MIDLSFSNSDVKQITKPLVFVVKAGSILGEYPELNYLLSALDAKETKDKVLRSPAPAEWSAPYIIFSVLTTDSTDKLESLRQAAGEAALRADADELVYVFPAKNPEELMAITEGALLGAYRFNKYLSSPRKIVEKLSFISKIEPKEEALQQLKISVDCIFKIRDLVNESPSELYPQALVNHFLQASQECGVGTEVWDYERLQAEGFGGIVGVGQGSSHKPYLLKLSWNPAGAKKHVALVGKGITFDSGGLSLKSSEFMLNMKTDMTGAATVGYALLAAARMRIPVRVTAWLAVAENFVSSTSQRPDDVLRMKSGKTVEVTNTDAEGRLVMADALHVATSEHPDLVIDMATLTGAQIIALGNRYAGVMGSANAEICAAADRVGETAWPMPLPTHLRKNLDSPIADMVNSARKREGGMLVAGMFLQEFINDCPWAHIDIAGPSFNEGEIWGYTPKGATGFGLRTLLEVLYTSANQD